MEASGTGENFMLKRKNTQITVSHAITMAILTIRPMPSEEPCNLKTLQ